MRKNYYKRKTPMRRNRRTGKTNYGFTYKKPAYQYSIPNPPPLMISNRPEKKTCDLPVQSISLSLTGTITLLNLIQEGSSFYNRVGRKIMSRSLRITGQVVPNSNGTSGISEYIRIMVIYDRQVNGAAPATSDILLTYDNTGSTTTTSLSHQNMNNAERFLVLMDTRISIPNNGSEVISLQGTSVIDYLGKYNIDRYIKLKGLETHYKASSSPAVIGDQASGGLYLFTLGNVTSGSNGYSLNFTSRLRFHDC